MFSLKAFFNFLGRNKLYTAINIFGFAISLTFVVLIGLYIQKELAIDNWHSKADRLYLLSKENGNTWAAKISSDISSRYPEIEATVRFETNIKPIQVEKQDQAANKKVLLTDSTFFTALTWQFIEGSPQSALNDMQSVVLSESYANEAFPGTQAIGRSVDIDGHQYTVTGVIKDIKNSIIKQHDAIIRFEAVAYEWDGYLTGYNAFNFPILVLVKPGASLDSKLEDMAEFFKSYTWIYNQGYATTVGLIPLRDAYWEEVDPYRFNGNSRDFIGILSICALAILLFAVINYINLSVAQTSFRAKEAATRRLLGGTKTELFNAFITESTIMCAVSLFLGITIASVIIGWFSSMMQTTVELESLLTVTNITIIVIAIVVLGFISGVIPAYIITRFKPISVVRGDFRRRSKMVLSKVLIGVQYLITIVLIGCAITVTKQTNYMINADLGFDRSAVLQLDNVLDNNKARALYNVLSEVPGVEQVSLCQGTPTTGGNNNSFTHEGINYSFTVFRGDSLFMPMLGIEIISQTGVIDKNAIWINQTAARHMNLKPGDTQIPFNNAMIPIKGVIKDFNTDAMTEQISDVAISDLGDEAPWNIMVRLTPSNNIAATRQAVEAKYSEFAGIVCEGTFMDQQVEQWYTKQKQTRSLVGVISMLAIIISALGILAMSTYFIRQRTSEIAIRKVFGSSNAGIFARLTRQFIIIIMIAFAIALPIIYFAMEWWLTEFAYRIRLTWEIFALAGLAAFAVAIITISWRAYQAMTANPVNSLKNN